jgi:hypothetical protein
MLESSDVWKETVSFPQEKQELTESSDTQLACATSNIALLTDAQKVVSK